MNKFFVPFLMLVFYANAEVSFINDVRPILSNKCFACHGFDEETRDADLRLDTFAGAVADLGGYQAVVPGDPDKSELIQRIITHDEDDIMPPKGDRLTDAEVNILKEWIRQGAEYKKHWAYEKIEQPRTPQAGNNWARSPIDKFVSKKLLNGLKNSSDADPAILLRRVSLDLTGLPPAVEDVLEFEKNPTDEAFEKYIDKLLASKKFGERWAVFWLDLARYGDSNGYQHDQRRTVWPYRDWVIKALN
ncbi:MAG: DUF1549 domain-containing protein, partial [Lentisphaerales bacterium]|nr:DUF1549 domain-containing protein [Lentisphaerales bacterium]